MPIFFIIDFGNLDTELCDKLQIMGEPYIRRVNVMSRILSGVESLSSTNRSGTLSWWGHQIAEITRLAWSCKKQIFHFPYYKLAERDYWRINMGDLMDQDKMMSWVYVVNGNIIVAHVSLIQKECPIIGEYWELGRMVCHPDFQNRGIMMQLAQTAKKAAEIYGFKVVVECTQANTFSQAICHKLSLRFAGIGVLPQREDNNPGMGGSKWDIIYYDNLPLTPFEPQAGLLNNHLGVNREAEDGHLPRLREINGIISTECGGQLPPTQFHILPIHEKAVQGIIRYNVDLGLVAV